jgi:Immunity protein Imm5
LPMWESSWPGDRTPHDLLALADAVIEGKTNRKEGARRRNRGFDALDDLSNRSRNKIPVGVGYAAAQTVATALGYDALNPSEVHPDLDDDGVQPEEHDSSYFAALVRAGGPPWDPASSVERRRAFWDWWLSEAVQAAAQA